MNLNVKLYEEYLKVRGQKPLRRFSIENVCFKEQLNFIKDKARLKALFCTRRAAKSYTGGIYLIKEALENPRCNVLFIGLTRMSAHGIIWKDILKTIDREYGLGIRFNETNLTATLSNGSVIWCTGADTDEDEMNKLLGRKYRLVVLDEASMFSINMRQLVYGVLKPATADQRGTICLLGTASNITRGLFYEITTQKEKGWSCHQWTAYDNPHVKEQWEEEIRDIKLNRPEFMETTLFKQWYLNLWQVDEDAKVYKYSKEKNSAPYLPLFDTPFRYVLGIDLGHSPDPSAFVIGAYHELSPNIYIVHAEKHLGMDVTAVCDKIKDLEAKWNFEAKVIDGSMKMAIAEMNTRHGVNVIPADKSGKEHWINLFNSEFVQGTIKLLLSADALADELETLVWVMDGDKVKLPRKEHPSIPNHLTDSMLYLLRYTHSYLRAPEPKKFVDMQKQSSWEPRHIENLVEAAKRDKDPHALELSEMNELFDLDFNDEF